MCNKMKNKTFNIPKKLRRDMILLYKANEKLQISKISYSRKSIFFILTKMFLLDSLSRDYFADLLNLNNVDFYRKIHVYFTNCLFC